MSTRIRKFAPHLSLMAKSKPKVAKAIVKNAGSDLIKCVCECAMNALKGNVPITGGQKRKLRRYKKDLRFLAGRSNSLARKKRVLQKGGILPALLAPLLGTVLPSIGGAIGNLIGGITGRR